MDPLTHMKLLVNLAQADGSITDREQNYIVNIGRANGVFPDQIHPILQREHEVIIPEDLSADEKFECIYSLVQLMKIDERMYQEEIRFCSSIAIKLGYKSEVLFELMLHVKGSAMADDEIERLKKTTQKFLEK